MEIKMTLTIAQRQARNIHRAHIAQALEVARAPAQHTDEQRYEALSTLTYEVEELRGDRSREIRYSILQAFIRDLESYEATQPALATRRTAE
jgi:hypothetical protein